MNLRNIKLDAEIVALVVLVATVAWLILRRH